eukprot:scaffold2041_cov251-Pinguiococcus_pyrenoidosus.AAC.2
MPKDWPLSTEDAIFAIPESWRDVQDHAELGLPELRLVGTGFVEPCDGEYANWCSEAIPLGKGPQPSAPAEAQRKKSVAGAQERQRVIQEKWENGKFRMHEASEDPDLRGNPKRVLSYSEPDTPKAIQLSENQSGWIVFIGLMLIVALAARATKGNESKKGV